MSIQSSVLEGDKQTFGTVDRPAIASKGRQRKVTKAMEEALVSYIEQCDQSPTLDEFATYLLEEYDVDLSVPTLHRTMKRLKYSHKRGERFNPARDDTLRSNYWARVCRYKASQLVVLDESAVNERNLDRRWGWSPTGVAYRMINTTPGRSRSWSILPAIGINGYLEFDINQGSFNGERFAIFIQKVLKKMNPFPGPRSVLLMDNASIHHIEGIQQLCDDKGVILDFLPPYSPDFSPIKESFQVLKAWVKKYRSFGKEMVDRDLFGLFLCLAVQEANLESKARAFFRRCGYEVADNDTDVDYQDLNDVVEVVADNIE